MEKSVGTTLFFIKDTDQLQQLEGGGVDVGRQFGDFLAKVFQITEVFGIGEMALVYFWVSPGFQAGFILQLAARILQRY